MVDLNPPELEHEDDIFTILEKDQRFRQVEVAKKGKIVRARVKFVEGEEIKEEEKDVRLGETNDTRFYRYDVREGSRRK